MKGARKLSVNVSNLEGLIEGTKTKARNKINEYHAKRITKVETPQASNLILLQISSAGGEFFFQSYLKLYIFHSERKLS